jgi:hypothetical protein
VGCAATMSSLTGGSPSVAMSAAPWSGMWSVVSFGMVDHPGSMRRAQAAPYMAEGLGVQQHCCLLEGVLRGT